MVETETATFWLDSPEIARGELRTGRHRHRGLLSSRPPAHAEKDGCFTNTQRLLQWHDKAVDPPGDARSDAGSSTTSAASEGEGRERSAAAPCRARRAHVGLSDHGPHQEPDIAEVLREINGWRVDTDDRSLFRLRRACQPTGRRRAAAGFIRACIQPPIAIARARAQPRGPYGHGWGFAWPSDRRILYNRASARPDGSPWSERKKLVWWDDAAQEWTGLDTPDFAVHKRARLSATATRRRG